MPAEKTSSKKKQKQCDPNHPHCARILLIDGQQRLLLVKELRKTSWNLPGGIIDPGEDAWTAAKRELLEESAVDITELPKPHDHRFIKNGGGVAYFVCKIEHSPTARANDQDEIAQVMWRNANAFHRYDTDDKTDHFLLRRGLQLCEDLIAETFPKRGLPTGVVHLVDNLVHKAPASNNEPSANDSAVSPASNNEPSAKDSATAPASNNEPSAKDKRINVSPTSDGHEIILEERYEVSPGHLLLALAEYVPDLKDLKTSGLRQYLKHEGELAVRYTDPGIGRMQIKPFAVDRTGNEQNLKITCQAHLWNWVKAVMCAKFYKDMDICNCHPVLLVQICKQHDLPCELLERYISERAKLIAETGLSKPDFKKLFFSSVLYHPECTDEQVARKLKKYNLEKEPNLFKELRTEMRACCTKLLKCYPCYTEAAKQYKGEDYHNLPGTALSLLVQTAEKRCIVALYKYWVDKKVRVGALIHDGLHVAIDDAKTPFSKTLNDTPTSLTSHIMAIYYNPFPITTFF